MKQRTPKTIIDDTVANMLETIVSIVKTLPGMSTHGGDITALGAVVMYALFSLVLPLLCLVAYITILLTFIPLLYVLLIAFEGISIVTIMLTLVVVVYTIKVNFTQETSSLKRAIIATVTTILLATPALCYFNSQPHAYAVAVAKKSLLYVLNKGIVLINPL